MESRNDVPSHLSLYLVHPYSVINCVPVVADHFQKCRAGRREPFSIDRSSALQRATTVVTSTKTTSSRYFHRLDVEARDARRRADLCDECHELKSDDQHLRSDDSHTRVARDSNSASTRARRRWRDKSNIATITSAMTPDRNDEDWKFQTSEPPE